MNNVGPAYGEVIHENKPLAVHLAAGLLPVKGGEDGKTSIVWEMVESFPSKSEVCLTSIRPDYIALNQLPTQVNSSLVPEPTRSQTKLYKEGDLRKRVDWWQVAVAALLPADLLRYGEVEDEVCLDTKIAAGVEKFPSRRTNQVSWIKLKQVVCILKA